MSKRKKKLPKRHWTTLDGRRLTPKQMETSHLINVLRFVQRGIRLRLIMQAKIEQNWAMDALAYAGGAPDGASYAAECAADEFGAKSFELRQAANDRDELWRLAIKTPIVKKIYLEAKRRGVSEKEMRL